MQRILVPIDFSDPSVHALEVAAQIAKAQGASIVMLHMLGLSEAVLTKNEEQEYKEAKYYLEQAKKRFKPLFDEAFLKGVDTKVIVQNYKDFKEVNKVAREQDIDLIVMGSARGQWTERLFCGLKYRKGGSHRRGPRAGGKNEKPGFQGRQHPLRL